MKFVALNMSQFVVAAVRHTAMPVRCIKQVVLRVCMKNWAMLDPVKKLKMVSADFNVNIFIFEKNTVIHHLNNLLAVKLLFQQSLHCIVSTL